MASAQLGAVLRQIQRLFSEGSSTALSDTQLLAGFAARRDEAAFAALVARHGPMVLAVCRGILRDPHDAEDAFQATFLVLARKAGSAWAEGQLGGWLHKVAYRIAVRASADAARRRALERRAAEVAAVEYTRDALEDDLRAAMPCDLRVVASFPNHLAARVLSAPGAGVRFFAPAMRNMLDRKFPVARFARSIDVLSCNCREWETLEDREEVAWQLSILVVTGGPLGSSVRYTTIAGEPGRLQVPAFPRNRPPRDTNRAGESYAATLLITLLDHGWDASSGVVEDDLIRTAAQRAAAAAALELDLVEFGFPDVSQIDEALRLGHIA